MGSLPALDIDLLRTFVLIAEGRSFTRAAERVGRTQSAVSLQIRRLEALVGHRLFERGKGGVVQVTAKGLDLLDHARAMAAFNDEIVTALRMTLEPNVGHNRRQIPAVRDSPPWIAVLPFQNMSRDPEQDYFAAGMVEDIIAALSRIGWLTVTAGGSATKYQGRSVTSSEIGRSLGVRYLLQGSVRKAAGRIRIGAQLVDADSDAILWAGKFDGALDGVFAFQDEIADQVAGILEPTLQRCEVERARRKRTETLDAYDLYLRALPHVAAQMPAEARKALPLLEQALRLDPDYIPAHALVAWCHELCFARDGFDASNRSAAIVHAHETLASDTDDGASLAIAGFVLSMLTSDHEAALSSIERGLAMNPSCGTALYLGAQAAGLAGRPATAMTFANRALRLSRNHPLAFEAHLALGEAAIMDRRYDDAVSCFARAASAKPNFSTAYIFEAISLSLAGQTETARPVVRRAFELEPGFRCRMFYELGLAHPLIDALMDGSTALGLPR